MREEMQRRGMPWTWWELAGGFGFYDPVAGGVRPDGLANALFGP